MFLFLLIVYSNVRNWFLICFSKHTWNYPNKFLSFVTVLNLIYIVEGDILLPFQIALLVPYTIYYGNFLYCIQIFTFFFLINFLNFIKVFILKLWVLKLHNLKYVLLFLWYFLKNEKSLLNNFFLSLILLWYPCIKLITIYIP